MKTSLGIAATLIALFSYIPYFRDIFAGKTKPHAFSWLVWFLLTAIAFVAQIKDGAKAGAWVTGFTALVSLFILGAAISRGEKNITKSDWLCLIGAFLAMSVWALTKSPLTAVILITIIDALGFAPTFRKAYHNPAQETLITFALSAVKFVIAIAALGNYTAVTVLYPASLVFMNGLFVTMLIIRRNQLGITKEKNTEVIPA
jgi:chromate transport protein ChrA